MQSPTRRDVLTVAAATVTLPMLDAALGKMKAASAATPAAPATKAAWVTTTLKPADVKDNEFTAVAGQKALLTRSGKTITAVTTICTHKQCEMKPAAGQKTVACQCHKSEFNLDGSVAKAPATKPLDHYAIQVNDKGLIEIDLGQKPAKDAKEFSITVA